MAWLSATYFGNTIWQYLLFLGILASAVLAGKVITWFSRNILKAIAAKTTTRADDILLDVLEAPVLFTVFIVVLWFGKRMLTLTELMRTVYDKAIVILVILNVAWYLSRLLGSIAHHYIQPLTAKTKTDLDDALIPIARRLVNVVIFTIAIIMVLDQMDVNVTSLVAGLGLGGLAFALAAQDLVANLFGGIAILSDKPFKIGDRIKIGTDVDGFVREIGLRTTRIETLASTMIVVPNSKVVDSILINISREKARQIIVDLGVEYGTSQKKLEEAKRIIIKNIKATKGLNPEKHTVAFSSFGDFSLNIKVIYWITKEGMDDYWGVQDRLNMAIKRDFEKAGIEFAFPTQTIHVKK